MSLKIKRLEVEGYKSLKHVVWEPEDLNVLIGPNGSGKSNLLRLLEMLSVTPQGSLDDFIKNEGGVGSLLWDGRAKEIKIKLSLFNCINQKDADNLETFYSFEMEPKPEWNYHVISNELIEQNLGLHGEPNQNVILLKQNDNRINFFRDDESVEQNANLSTGRETALSQVQRSRPHEILVNISSFFIKSTFFFSPNTAYKSDLRSQSITRYEEKLSGDGSNLINFLHTVYSEHPDIWDDVITGMKAAFGSAFEDIIFSPAADQHIQMRIRWKNLKWAQPTSALSDGILKYLFIVAIFADSKNHSLIAIDEPETGLHPAMFPIIAEYAAEASQNSQVIITTHSPEFLNAFDEDVPTVTVFDWVDGETELTTLSGEKLEYWLKEYKLGEMFRSGGLEAI